MSSFHLHTIRRHLALVGLLACALPAAASALLLDTGDGLGNTAAPSPDPGWHHVGHRLGGPTVIYLGHGWVLTANHVGIGVVVFDGKHFDPIKGSDVRIQNADGSATDLLVFQIESPPPLPPLPIATRAPLPGQEVILIGTGSVRGLPITIDTPEHTLLDGYHWLSASEKRWGTNTIAARPQPVSLARSRTLAIPTIFNRLDDPRATRHEAQAADGDSGGALFADRMPFLDEADYALAGLMFTVSNWNGQPHKTSFYGDVTYSANLAEYRDQIIAIVRPACSNEVDDDADGAVDHPSDPDCGSVADDSESDARPRVLGAFSGWPITLIGGCVLLTCLGAGRLLYGRRA